MPSPIVNQGIKLFPWRARSPKRGLQYYLTHRTRQDVFRKEYTITGRRLGLGLYSAEGRVSDIGGLKSGPLYADFRKEDQAGEKAAFLYGWYKRAAWGDYARCALKYLYSRTVGEVWHLLKKPEALIGQSKHQRAIEDNRPLYRALSEGLGQTPLRLSWTVRKKARKTRLIIIRFKGRVYSIGGFFGHRKVFSLITEENGQIVSRFYANARDANKGKRLLKTVALTKKTAQGQWPDKLKIVVLYTDPAATAQYAKLLSRQRLQFLLNDQKPGAAIDVGKRKVVKGQVKLRLDGIEIDLPRLAGFKSVVGRIINHGTEKRIYFWPSEQARQSGAPAIIPEGQCIAQKKDGHWEILWDDHFCERGKAIVETIKLGNFIFATVGNRTRGTYWTVKDYPCDNGRLYPRALRMIRRRLLSIPLNGVTGVNGRVYTDILEFGGWLKLAEVWRDKWEFNSHAPPFAAWFIAVSPNRDTVNPKRDDKQKGSSWKIFRHPV
ncbi:MAG TPA: hypothetical protein VMT55_04765, partial [Candidatus Sulfotelmatobacter sp.]|nr:hypothetical protein [Candidatus Sulfotelmatobacter sp.]